MTSLLAVVGSVTPPGRLNAAIATAVEVAAARPSVSASLLNLADHRVSFTDQASRTALADLVDALLAMPLAAGGAFGPPPLAAGRG